MSQNDYFSAFSKAAADAYSAAYPLAVLPAVDTLLVSPIVDPASGTIEISDDYRPNLSSSNLLDTEEVKEIMVDSDPQELARLRKVEARFVEMGRAFKALKSNQVALEKVLIANTSIKSFIRPSDFVELESYLRIASSNQDAGFELTKLAQDILTLKTAKDEEANAHADMYAACQFKLVQREEEINRLKHAMRKMDGASSPNEGTLTKTVDLVGSNSDTLTLKLKLRETMTALKKVTEERNEALEKVRETTPHFQSSKSLNSLSEFARGHAPSDAVTLSKQPACCIEIETKMKNEINALTSKLDLLSNSESVLKVLTGSLRAEIDGLLDQQTKYATDELCLQNMAKDAREQAASMFDDMSSLAEEIDKLKETILHLTQSNTSLLEGDSKKAFETLRADDLAKRAEMELQLSNLLGIILKLTGELSEANAKLEISAEKCGEEGLTSVSLFDLEELQRQKDLVAKLEKIRIELNHEISVSQRNLDDCKRSITVLQSQIERQAKEYGQVKLEKSELVSNLEEARKNVSAFKAAKNKEISDLNAKIEELQLNASPGASPTTLNGDPVLISTIDWQVTAKKHKDRIDDLENQNLKNEESRELDMTKISGLKIDLNSKIDLIRDLEEHAKSAESYIGNAEKKFADSVAAYDAEKIILEFELSKAVESNSVLEAKITEIRKKLFDYEKEITQSVHNKSTIDDLTKKLADKIAEIDVVNRLLAEEGEKKAKSMQLLRHSKTRILKLEADLGQMSSQLKVAIDTGKYDTLVVEQDVTKQNLAEADKLVASLKRSIGNEQEKVKYYQAQLIEHDEKFNSVVAQAVMDSSVLKTENATLKKHLDSWPSKMKEYETRIEIIEQDLESSRSLFQSKSIDYDMMKIRIAELEGNLYEGSLDVNKHLEEVSSLKRHVAESQAKVREHLHQILLHTQTIVSLEEKNKRFEIDIVAGQARHETLLEQNKTSEKSSVSLELLNLDTSMELSVKKVLSDFKKIRVTELEEKLLMYNRDKMLWSKEKDSLMSDFRMRETQLKNLNKALKDECKKLGMVLTSPASSSPTSPIFPRPNQNNHMPRVTVANNISTEIPRLNSGSEMVSTPNMEYLRAVILKFLETKDKRKQLLGVIATLLNFTPQEISRTEKLFK